MSTGLDYLLVKRYDRLCWPRPDGKPVLERLHQEDLRQTHVIVPDRKYQKEGGPSLKECFALLRDVSSAPVVDLARNGACSTSTLQPWRNPYDNCNTALRRTQPARRLVLGRRSPRPQEC